MKTILSIIAMIASVLLQCTSSQKIIIQYKNSIKIINGAYYKYIVMDTTGTCEFIKKDGKYQRWQPDSNTIREYEKILITHLTEDTNIKIKYSGATTGYLHKNIGKYYCQISGYIVDNKKCLYCNYFWSDSSFMRRFDWTNEWLQMEDGGDRYWHVLYDSENKKIIELYTNGIA